MRGRMLFRVKLRILMSELTEKSPIFTGLILLTGQDAPGAARGLFTSLSEFAIQIIDVEQIVINDRLILTVLLTLNPAHQDAIETDLNLFADSSGFDIATIFCEQSKIGTPKECIGIEVTSEKMHPMVLMTVAKGIENLKGNIESITRVNQEKIALLFKVSGADLPATVKAMNELPFENTPVIRVFSL
jgi:phosphoserine phosphatase